MFSCNISIKLRDSSLAHFTKVVYCNRPSAPDHVFLVSHYDCGRYWCTTTYVWLLRGITVPFALLTTHPYTTTNTQHSVYSVH